MNYCIHSSVLITFFQDIPQEMVLPTFRMNLSASIKRIKTIPHSHAQSSTQSTQSLIPIHDLSHFIFFLSIN